MCEEKIQRYIHQIQNNARYNAFISVDEEKIFKMAGESNRRLLQGIPRSLIEGTAIAIKDNIHVAGMPNTAGTPALKEFIPCKSAPIVEKLISAGGICIGKTNMHELAFGTTGYNYAFYKDQIGIRNAFDFNKIAGGSSSGSAVAVAMSMCDFALGTDTGGSVRIPAALNGVVGFRPTTGRYSSDGLTPISFTRDTIGILAKNVQTVHLVDSVIMNYDVMIEHSKDNLRLGYDESQCLLNADDETIKCWQMVLEILKNDERITLVRVDMKPVYEKNAQVSLPIFTHELKEILIDYLEKYNTGLSIEQLISQIVSPDVKALYEKLILHREDGKMILPDKTVYDEVMINLRPQMINAYNAVLTENKLHAIIAPTTPDGAVEADPQKLFYLDATEGVSFEKFVSNLLYISYIQNAELSSCVGFPSISIPFIPTEGMPLGFMLDGRAHGDEELLSIACYVESVLNSQ